MVDQRFFGSCGPVSLANLLTKAGFADLIVPGAEEFVVSGAEELDQAGQGDLSLAAQKKYSEKLEKSHAGAVFVTPPLAELLPTGSLGIVSKQAHLVFVEVLNALYPVSQYCLAAMIGEESVGRAHLEENITIGVGAVIGAGAEIGSGTRIGPNAVVGPGVTIGRDCSIGAGASIEFTLMGDNVVIHSGARLGTAGFGWLGHGKTNIPVPQLGRVILQNRVEIGANASIDRGALGDTVIGENTKIDNLVQIGHNCNIGRNCLIAAMTGLAGATILGDGVLIAGGVGIAGHLSIGAGSVLLAKSGISKDWPAGSRIAGTPAQDVREYWRGLAVVRRMSRGDK